MNERYPNNRTAGRLRGKGGFTLAETLVTLLILGLVSAGMAAGIRFGVAQYQQSVRLSEARLLCSTLTNVIRGELANTTTVELGENTGGTEYAVLRFFSPNYAMKESRSAFLSVDVTKDDLTLTEYGVLLLGQVDASGAVSGNLLINSAAYSSYGLRANADVRYDKSLQIFIVTLRIRSGEGSDDLLSSSFDVLPLNDLRLPDSAAPEE